MRLSSKIFPHNFKSFIVYLKVIERQKMVRGVKTAFFTTLDPVKLNIRQNLFRLQKPLESQPGTKRLKHQKCTFSEDGPYRNVVREIFF
eukprot:UN21174